MKTTHTTTAALALALSVFLAHGAAAQTAPADPKNPSSMNDSKMNTTTNPSSTTSSSTYDTTNPSSTTTTTTTSTTPLTATGKVVTKNADSVIVLTDAGQRVTVYTDASSTLPTTTWAVGDRVTVSYTTPTVGRNHADSIVIASAPSSGYGTTTSTTTTADTANSNSYGTSTTDTQPASTLPKTASNMPLTLLLGSFAGAAAVGLHLARRSA